MSRTGRSRAPPDYQTEQRCPAGLAIADPGLQEKALSNSVMFESGPITRYLAGGCGPAAI